MKFVYAILGAVNVRNKAEIWNKKLSFVKTRYNINSRNLYFVEFAFFVRCPQEYGLTLKVFQ